MPGRVLLVLRAELTTSRRLHRLNWIASVAFTLGGSLFALGAWLSQVGSAGGGTISSVYLAAEPSSAVAATPPFSERPTRHAGSPTASARGQGWRWWTYEPMRLDWLAPFVLFAGTLVFAISLIDSFLQGLSVKQENRLIWAPEMIGCAMFLISDTSRWSRSATAGPAGAAATSAGGSSPPTSSARCSS